jgi:hypothetical protein
MKWIVVSEKRDPYYAIKIQHEKPKHRNVYDGAQASCKAHYNDLKLTDLKTVEKYV